MKTKLFFSMALIGLSLFSCKKEIDGTKLDSRQELKAFFSKNTARTQTFQVDLSTGGATITGEKGTVVQIPQNAFVDAQGNPVTGDVTIELKEILDKAGMVLSGITSVSGSDILESGGEIFLNATADGQQLTIADNSSIVIGVAKQDSIDRFGMQLFEGQGNGDNFDWNPIQQDTIGEILPANPNDSTGMGWNWPNNPYFRYDNYFCGCYNASKYFLTIETLGWVNIDRFYYCADGQKDITINTPGFNPQNSSVFVIVKDINSAINVYADIDAHAGSYGLRLNTGEEVTVIFIGNKNGKFYLDSKDYTISQGMTFDLEPEETTEDQLAADIISICS